MHIHIYQQNSVLKAVVFNPGLGDPTLCTFPVSYLKGALTHLFLKTKIGKHMLFGNSFIHKNS